MNPVVRPFPAMATRARPRPLFAASKQVIRANRCGSALVTTLIGLLLLELAIAGMLYVCMQERLVASVFTERLAVRLAARSAVDAVLANWPADSLRLLRPGEVYSPVEASDTLAGGESFDAEIERLHGGWFLVRGAGRPARRDVVGARAGAVVSMFETATIWRDFAAPLSAGGDVTIRAGTVIDGLHVAALPPSWDPGDCPATILADADSLLVAGVRPAIIVAPEPNVDVHATSILEGWPAIARDSMIGLAGAFDYAGPLDLARVVSFADRIETGSVSPAPVVAGDACVTSAAGNWGDPGGTGPCADFFPLIYAPGDLEITGGAGQGVMIVDGHLSIGPGAHFTGAISARGGVTVEHASVLGAVRAGSATSIMAADLRYSICALGRAFASTSVFRRPIRHGERWWVPMF